MSDAPVGRTIRTNTFMTVQLRVAQAFRDGAPQVAVWGKAGIGKTYAIEHLVGTLRDKGEAAHLYHCDTQPTERDLCLGLWESLTGIFEEISTREAKRRIRDEFLCGPKRVLVVIDEAQRMSPRLFDTVRWFRDSRRADSNFTVVYVGGPEVKEKIFGHPMLESRIRERVDCDGLSDREAVELIPDFHPMFEDLPPEELIRLRDRLNGQLRQLEYFTQLAVVRLKRHSAERLTPSLVADVLEAMGREEAA